MTDDLDTILNEALTDGSVLKTAQLVNLAFTITAVGPPHDNVFPAEYDAEGKETKAARTSRSYKATIVFDTDPEPVSAWLGGGWLTPQIEALVSRNVLPAHVKVIRDTTKDGNPYILVSAGRPAGQSETVVKAVADAHANLPAGNGKSPAQRAIELFELKRLNVDELTLANLVSTHGGGEALMYLETGQLALDPTTISRMEPGVLIGLIRVLQ